MSRLAFFSVVLKETFKKFIGENTTAKSASIAFYSLFSLPAILILMISIVGRVFGEQVAAGQIFVFLEEFMGYNNAVEVQTLVQNVSRDGSGIGTTILSVLALFFSGATVISSLKSNLNSIWGVKAIHHKGTLFKFAADRILSVFMIIVLGLILFLSLIIDSIIILFRELLPTFFPGNVLSLFYLINNIISLGILALIFSVIFKILPDVMIQWRDVLVGATFTTVLFTIGKYLIGFYLGTTSKVTAYGAAGSLVVLLLWIYYSINILLLGVEFTQVYTLKLGRKIRAKENAVYYDRMKSIELM